MFVGSIVMIKCVKAQQDRLVKDSSLNLIGSNIERMGGSLWCQLARATMD